MDRNSNDEQRSGSLVVRCGTLDAEELAALTAVLHLRAASQVPQPAAPSRRGRPVATWRGPERGSAYHGPRTWRTGATGPF